MEKTYGKTVLPLSRVKRIIKQDEDVHYCSNASALLISVATVCVLLINQLSGRLSAILIA